MHVYLYLFTGPLLLLLLLRLLLFAFAHHPREEGGLLGLSSIAPWAWPWLSNASRVLGYIFFFCYFFVNTHTLIRTEKGWWRGTGGGGGVLCAAWSCSFFLAIHVMMESKTRVDSGHMNHAGTQLSSMAFRGRYSNLNISPAAVQCPISFNRHTHTAQQIVSH